MTLNLTGQTIAGRYHILSELGRGGMAVVYRAHQTSLGRDVALKILPSHLARDQRFVARFAREAQSAARLDHPNIVSIFDVGQDGDIYFIAMRLLDGLSLNELLQRTGLLPPQRTVHVLTQIANALDYAHQQGLVHRDIKPPNIIIGPGDYATLTDFGIARATEGPKITLTGEVIGTPEYMAPEQVKGQPATPATDLYALGVMAYEMFTGVLPHRGNTPHAILHSIVYEPPPKPRSINPQITPAMEGVLLYALSKEPPQRFRTGHEFVSALQGALTTGSPIAPPSGTGQPATGGPAYQQPATGGPTYQQPATGGTAYQQPATGGPTYQQPATGGTAYRQPATGGPTHQQPATGGPAYQQPATGGPTYQQPATGGTAYRQPVAGQSKRRRTTDWTPVVATGLVTFVILIVGMVAVAGGGRRTPPSQATPKVAIAATAPAGKSNPLVIDYNIIGTRTAVAHQATSVAATVTTLVEAQGTATARAIAQARNRDRATAQAKARTTAAAAERVATMTASAVCRVSVNGSFASIYRQAATKSGLGCPANAGHSVWSAIESFERGMMLWREDQKAIYVLSSDGRWNEFADQWREGDATWSCPDSAPTNSPPTPLRGFGRVWCKEQGVRDRLGWATDVEHGDTRRVQDFQQGVMFQAEDHIYVLYRDHYTWERH